MTLARYDVAIVGAGPTGLTLANLLGLSGVRTVLIERHDGTVREPRAVSIDDESLRTMQATGLVEAIIADCALDYGSHYFTASGACFARVEPSTREYGFPRRNAFTQPRLEATLHAGLGRFAHVTRMFSWTCTQVEDVGDAVRLALQDSKGASASIMASYVVGCDGARSEIRRAIGASLSGTTYEQPWLIVDLGATRERMRQTRVVCDPRRPFITLPGPGGIRRYEFLLFEGESESAADPPFVRDLLARGGPDADAPIVRRQVYTFHARIADRWRRGRVFLAGDAAHLSPPFAGQGMNSGLRDAHNLAWKLASVVAGQCADHVLDSYQTERLPHASALIDLAVRMGKVMMPTSRVQAALVQSAFRVMRLAPGLHSYFAEMKYKPKPFYRDGFLATIPSGARWTGRMAPQPLVEREDRTRLMLDELLGNGFALLAYGAEAQRTLDAASRCDLGSGVSAQVAILPQAINPDRNGPRRSECVRDVGGSLKSFIPEGEIVMLVRPDRYICVAAERKDLETFLRSACALLGRDAQPRAAMSAPIREAGVSRLAPELS